MYQIVRIEDMVRVPAEHFNEELEVTLKKILAEQYEGKLDREIGSLITVLDVKSDGIGRVIPGDGAAYYNASFRALTYKPELQEIVEGDVIEIVEFGAFVRLGPLDGLVHVSQITDDYLNYDEKGQRFMGKESKKTLENGDKVRARIVTISLKKAKENKIGLTMRQPGLGKLDWINQKEEPTEKKVKTPKKGAKK
ncbi:MAG: DNA-directed RNA polymerase [archaeon]|jgi:DNA-directed RNA polymerase subunit E'|nr:DNA-directed RNA polymerase [Euryarchaeota archaeon]MDP6703883.1 DNA-directed RNA polymerase [archaeon]MDP7260867.1 DNA-directed RNA polymerase [archaeon]|tara:strand:- start:16207 stop:16791 length:585 start_codon:yes stop_codon:yes gene_type:complete